MCRMVSFSRSIWDRFVVMVTLCRETNWEVVVMVHFPPAILSFNFVSLRLDFRFFTAIARALG